MLFVYNFMSWKWDLTERKYVSGDNTLFTIGDGTRITVALQVIIYIETSRTVLSQLLLADQSVFSQNEDRQITKMSSTMHATPSVMSVLPRGAILISVRDWTIACMSEWVMSESESYNWFGASRGINSYNPQCRYSYPYRSSKVALVQFVTVCLNFYELDGLPIS